MKARYILPFFAVVLLFYAFFPSYKNPLFLPFDQTMSKINPSFDLCYESKRKEQWTLIKALYEKHLQKAPFKKPHIPKIIHQIWLGSPLPKQYVALQKSWQEKHPDWQYFLWTDEEVKTFPFANKKRFDQAVNVGEKADILRYEVLNRFGGLYVDTDFECIKPFDPFHLSCDFYVGVEASFLPDAEVSIGNALIGSIPNHPILQYCLKRIGEKGVATTADEVQDISGPGCLRRAFFKCYKKKGYRNIAFPYTFFYPLPSKEKSGFIDEIAKNLWQEPESFGIHYWDTSWANEKNF